MISIRYESTIPGVPGLRADAVVDDSVYEVFIEPRDIRQIRASFVDLARASTSERIRSVALVLEEPKITKDRLVAEWKNALDVLRPEIAQRLTMYVRSAGEWMGIPDSPDHQKIATLEKILHHNLSHRSANRSRGPEAYYEILRILIHEWLLGKGRLPINEIMKASGTSHPTVSRALDRLDHYLVRHSDRSVELRCFPREEWERLVAISDKVRSTIRFVDRSGLPRSPESLLKRLHKLRLSNIAVGGVFGAKHYLPNLDIMGAARLDLSISSPGKALDLSFIKKLDPGLEPSTNRNEVPLVVIHKIHRANAFFNPNKETGILWADPVECLLDLHEARLEPQALEFLKSFSPMKRHPIQ